MKALFKFFILAFFILTLGCDKDENSPVVCLPTELPSEESIMILTYNSDRLLELIQYQHYGDSQPLEIKSFITYQNGKILTIDELKNTEKMSYYTFTYTSNTILTSYYQKDGSDFVKRKQTTYYLQNNKIIQFTSIDLQYDDYDSAAYTYDANNNIVHTDHFNEDHIKVQTTDFEYDNKTNPFYKAGINGWDNEFFNEENLSSNNIVKITYTYLDTDDTEIELATYTYDSDGKPLTRKYDWELETRSFQYECK